MTRRTSLKAEAASVERVESLTELLTRSREGSPEALDRLVPLVYDELRAIAHRQLRAERADHTLSTTALVHEAYLRLVDQERVDWRDRTHFFAVAARVMRRVLVDYARRRVAKKREGGREAIPLDSAVIAVDEQADMLLALDEALSRLSDLDLRLVRVVEMRFFAGLTEEETAEALGVSSRTIRNDWVKAKGWLYRELQEEPPSESAG
jgi:RNA polymerase sigma factor (TIGR02999 family)